MRVAIIGTGYVGLTTGVSLAFLGHDVTCIDHDLSKLGLLMAGKSPIHEPGMEELMRIARARLSFTSDTRSSVALADVVIIAVGTPALESGEADLRFVEAAAHEVGQGLVPGRAYTVVIKSTVPIGSNGRISVIIQNTLNDRAVDAHVCMASNPEFLREGSAMSDSLYPDRIVIGAQEPYAVEQLQHLYEPLLKQSFDPPGFLKRPKHYPLPPCLVTQPATAEMIKYASNAFLALKISFANEIAGLCERVEADITDVVQGIGMDSRIGPKFLGAGLGWGGSCFPKDTAALIAMGSQVGYSMPIVSATREVNFRQRQGIIEKLDSNLGGLKGRVVVVLGLAFKPNTDDVREAPALDIVQMLLQRGAVVRVHDPVALSNAKRLLDPLVIDYCEDLYAAVTGADAVVIATEWDEYRSMDLTRLRVTMRNALVVDGRNILSPLTVSRHGLQYVGVGRPHVAVAFSS